MSTRINIIHPIKHPAVLNFPVEFQDGIVISNGIDQGIPGSIWYDSDKSCLNIRNEYSDSVLQVGQELYTHICNKTGTTLYDGEIVYIDGFDVTSGCFTVSLAKADSLDTAKILGMVTTDIPNNSRGLITKFGRVNEIDTSGEVSGAPIFLSDSVAGEWVTVKPAVAIRVGFIGEVSTNGSVLIDIDEKPPSIYGSFYSDATQTYNGTDSEVVTLNNEFAKIGLGHSNTVSPEEITFYSSGSYIVTGNFEVYRTSGANAEDYRVWLQKYPSGGTAWENIPYTNIKTSVYNGGETARLSANVGAYFFRGDKVRIVARASDSTIEIQAIAASGDEPAQASVMFSIYRLGD